MIALRPGQRLLPGRVIMAEGLLLTYQTDSNLVLYRNTTPVWATMTFDTPGYVEMQGDGNLVMYNIDGVPLWATNTFTPGAVLELVAAGMRVVVVEPSVLWTTPPLPGPTPAPPGNVRKLMGPVRPLNQSFADGNGPRYIHGCTDFGGIVKHHEDRDNSLRSLDITASHQQFIRVAWRLNGWLWTPSGLTIDPIRDVWWEPVVFDYLQCCRDRGLRVVLTCADMYNWSNAQARNYMEVLAHLAQQTGSDTVIMHEWNEMRYTCPNGENDVNFLRELTQLWQNIYPTNLRGLSDPGSQDQVGMEKLSQNPANMALIHNVRHTPNDAIRRAFNIHYDNYPGKPICEGEPTGPETPNPGGLYGGHVFQPVENHDDLFAIATENILSGLIFTYFNDPALVSRMPLDSTWGFKEIPELWRRLDIPENVGQGRLIPGHKPDAPLKLTPGPSNARADSVEIDGKSFGIMSAEARAVAGRNGTLTMARGSGIIHEGPISVGQTIPVSGPAPTLCIIR